MFKRSRIIVLVLMILALMIPSSSFARPSSDVLIHVRNQTGGVVEIILTNSEGSVTDHFLPAGQSTFQSAEGIFSYYAKTPCGIQTGVMNFSVSKTLMFSCKSGKMEYSYKIATDANFCNLGYYEDFVDQNIEDHFVSWTHQSAKILDIINNRLGDPSTTLEGAVAVLNIDYYGQATYTIGCYDNQTLLLVLP